MRGLRSNGSLMGLVLVVGLLVSDAAGMRPQGDGGRAPAYAVAQLLPVAVEPGVTISPEYVEGLQARMARALEDSKRFTTVVSSADMGVAAGGPTLRVASTVTRFVPGNRAERYLIGMGAGATKITVHLVFTDASTSKVLLGKDVKGLIWYGAAIKGFGDPNSAQKDVAKDIRKIVQEHF